MKSNLNNSLNLVRLRRHMNWMTYKSPEKRFLSQMRISADLKIVLHRSKEHGHTVKVTRFVRHSGNEVPLATVTHTHTNTQSTQWPALLWMPIVAQTYLPVSSNILYSRPHWVWSSDTFPQPASHSFWVARDWSKLLCMTSSVRVYQPITVTNKPWVCIYGGAQEKL